MKRSRTTYGLGEGRLADGPRRLGIRVDRPRVEARDGRPKLRPLRKERVEELRARGLMERDLPILEMPRRLDPPLNWGEVFRRLERLGLITRTRGERYVEGAYRELEFFLLVEGLNV